MTSVSLSRPRCLRSVSRPAIGLSVSRALDSCLALRPKYWDQHFGLKAKHESNARETDKPIAGLLTDLKQRGLLKDTLVIWGGEFGRTPSAQNGDGRDHNNRGY